ncbi:MAG: alpha/beta hydrolase [Immundisolibacteraceae bacterium]|nr:alpha/beta hydrolase [Immundisolibacteraceae bacterium]
MKQQVAEKILISGPAGDLELKLDLPSSLPIDVPLVVVAHPHPQHGGTMDNKVVYSLARELSALGLPVARFNFRGVGASLGEYADGVGEAEDMVAVVGWMTLKYPGRPIWLAGFSFGGYIAARISIQCAAQHLVLVAPAVTREYFDVAAQVSCAALLIHGEIDQLNDPKAAKDWSEQQPGSVSYEPVAEADHFFHGKLNELRRLISTYGRSWLDSS